MELERFVADRAGSWQALDQLVRTADRVDQTGVRRLAELHRSAAADLAFARRRYAGHPVVESLEGLVRRSRAVVYAVPPKTEGVLSEFVVAGYWQRAAAAPRLLALAAALLLVPAVVGAVWAGLDPVHAAQVLPASLRRVDPGAPVPLDLLTGLPRGVPGAGGSWGAGRALEVAVLALVGGLAAGLGTAYVLVTEGLALGVPAGLAISAGDGAGLALVSGATGLLQLASVVVVAAAGLRVGAALVDPGDQPRREALVTSARDGALVLSGTLPWLGVAAMLAALTRSIGPGLGAVVGVVAALGYLGLLVSLRSPLPPAAVG